MENKNLQRKVCRMFEVIEKEYGKELGGFEFDYLGEHPSLDVVLINAKVKLYDSSFAVK